ncbi:hypothetical protein [Streptomyces natalensis]|nr:hypothetical protein [Streptomyces natalensis]
MTLSATSPFAGFDHVQVLLRAKEQPRGVAGEDVALDRAPATGMGQLPAGLTVLPVQVETALADALTGPRPR